MNKNLSLDWWRHDADKTITIGMVGLHLMALAGFVPALFSWSGVLWFLVLYWFSGGLGITLTYHRLLTHRSFKTNRAMRFFLTTCGCLAWQGSPIVWVGTHRLHHKESDTPRDPHSPTAGFSWAHMLWVLSRGDDVFRAREYARDLAREPMMRFLDKFWWLPQVVVTAGLFIGGVLVGDVWLGLSWVAWGVGVRTVAVFHATWFVNSASHMWGYQNFTDTGDHSRNLWWVALITFGEGWHNNHHADQTSAAHGMRWFEFDITYWTIRFLKLCGLATDIKMPKRAPK